MSGVTDIVSAVIPCLDEEHAIGAVVAAVLAHGVAEVIVVDAASSGRSSVQRRQAHGLSSNRGVAMGAPFKPASLRCARTPASCYFSTAMAAIRDRTHQRVRPSSSAARAFAASAIPEACLCRRSRPGWSADASADGLWRALQRSFAVSRHPPGCVASTRHARHHLRLEPGNADACGRSRLTGLGDPGRPAPPGRRRAESVRKFCRRHQGRGGSRVPRAQLAAARATALSGALAHQTSVM
jgi:hypothetical protein